MEFKFAVNDVFRQPVVQVGSNLLPPGFTGDRRAFWDVVGKVSEIVNAMGEASAAAQGLTKPITTAERLRNSEHTLYFLVDQNAANGRGAVTGMLKTGKKGLYVFDRNGQHYQVSPPCVLDFYIHESRQRTGLGKRLFEHMLQVEGIEPVKMAIDRPSEKFLGFLNKHYTLNDPVKQMNNYVVFDGFFPSSPEKNGAMEIDQSVSTPVKKQSANGLQTSSYASPLGRYGAPRPPCSMGQIIHNQSSAIKQNTEPKGVEGVRSAPETSYLITAGRSPGNPNVIQSTPNVYYRSQESKIKLDGLSQEPVYPIANQNAEQAGYYQRQSNWQNVGDVNNVVGHNHYYNDQNVQQTRITNAHQQQTKEQNLIDQSRVTHRLLTNDQSGIRNTQPDVETQYNMYNSLQAQNYAPQTGYQNVQQYAVPNLNTIQQNNLPAYGENMTGDTQINSYLVQPTSQTTNLSQPQQNQVVPPHYSHSLGTQNSYVVQQQSTSPPNVILPQQQPIVAETQNNSYVVQQNLPGANINQQNQNIPQHPPLMEAQNSSYVVQQNQIIPQPSPVVDTQNNGYVVQQYQAVPHQRSSVTDARNIHPIQQSSPEIQLQPVRSKAQYIYTPQSNPSIYQQNVDQNQTISTDNANFQNIPTYSMQQNHNIQHGAGNIQGVTDVSNRIIPQLNTSTYQVGQQPNVPVSTTVNMAPQYHAQNEMQHTTSAPNMAQSHVNMSRQSISQANNALSKINMIQNNNDQTNMRQTQNVTSYNEQQTINHQAPLNDAEYKDSNDVKITQAPVYNERGDMGYIDPDVATFEYGYPPQVPEPGTQVMEEKVSSSPKLERPRSLSIQLSEEQTEDKKNDDVESEVPPNETQIEEEIIEKLEISENDADIEQKDDKVGTPENKSPGKKTPSHLTEQGFFDLKFYHNKLW